MTDASYGKGVILHTIRTRKAFSEVSLADLQFRTAGGNCYGEPTESRRPVYIGNLDEYIELYLKHQRYHRRFTDQHRMALPRRRRTELAKRQKRHLKALGKL